MTFLGRLRRALRSEGDVVEENTGDAVETDGGKAVTGFSGPPPRRGGRVVVRNTGNACAHGKGSRSVSGVDYTEEE